MDCKKSVAGRTNNVRQLPRELVVWQSKPSPFSLGVGHAQAFGEVVRYRTDDPDIGRKDVRTREKLKKRLRNRTGYLEKQEQKGKWAVVVESSALRRKVVLRAPIRATKVPWRPYVRPGAGDWDAGVRRWCEYRWAGGTERRSRTWTARYSRERSVDRSCLVSRVSYTWRLVGDEAAHVLKPSTD